MTEGLTRIITELEQRKTAIEKALAALREVGQVAAPAPPTTSPAHAQQAASRKQYKFSEAARERMRQGQRKRYAHLHTVLGRSKTAAASPTEPTKRKISPEGLKRIIAATKRRWRLKRAADKAALEQA